MKRWRSDIASSHRFCDYIEIRQSKRKLMPDDCERGQWKPEGHAGRGTWCHSGPHRTTVGSESYAVGHLSCGCDVTGLVIETETRLSRSA